MIQRIFYIYFYFAGVAAGVARGTGVCFSTWLAVAHSASLAGLQVFFTMVPRTCNATAALCAESSNPPVAPACVPRAVPLVVTAVSKAVMSVLRGLKVEG